MPLPGSIKLKALLFGDGPGMKLQVYSNEELGVRVDAVCKKGKWTETWTHRNMPGQSFSTYEELRNAYARIEEERT